MKFFLLNKEIIEPLDTFTDLAAPKIFLTGHRWKVESQSEVEIDLAKETALYLPEDILCLQTWTHRLLDCILGRDQGLYCIFDDDTGGVAQAFSLTTE